jgi:hypothetical protein
MRSGWAGTGTIAAAGLLAGLLGGWKLAVGVSRQMPTTHGEWVKFTNAAGDAIRAYVAYPERKDKAPGIIVIHEIFGLTDWEPTVADKLAGAGYVAVVPDLLSPRFGASPADPDSGRKLIPSGSRSGERRSRCGLQLPRIPSVGPVGRHRHDRVLLGWGDRSPMPLRIAISRPR